MSKVNPSFSHNHHFPAYSSSSKCFVWMIRSRHIIHFTILSEYSIPQMRTFGRKLTYPLFWRYHLLLQLILTSFSLFSHYLNMNSLFFNCLPFLQKLPSLTSLLLIAPGNPLQYSCLENPHGQRSLEGWSPWCHNESDTTEQRCTAQFSHIHLLHH